jgi:hypothetical protein
MRSQLVARRIILAPALALTLAAAVAACSSSSSPSSSSSTGATSAPASSAPASSSSSTPASSSSSTAVAQITANWEKFFDSSTPVAQKVTLLQNGDTFATAISSLSKLPLTSGLGAKVTNVTVNSATSATVTYNLVASGTSLLSNQTGKAVYQDGIWKVGDASLCGLLHLVPGGTVPAACNSAS